MGRDDTDDGDREPTRPRYTGKKESQHFTNSSSSRNGGNEFDIKAIWKTNLFPQPSNPKPKLTTTYKERQVEVELTMSGRKGTGWYQHDDLEMDYKLTVTFKITENKLVAELVIVESEKEREEEAAPPPPKKPSKSKPDCLACYDGKRYSSEHKKKIVPLCYNEHDKLYQDLRYPELFSKSKNGKTKARKKLGFFFFNMTEIMK